MAAFAFAVTVLFGKQFGHHEINFPALGDEMSVAAMIAGNIIGITERGADTGGNSFLAKT